MPERRRTFSRPVERQEERRELALHDRRVPYTLKRSSARRTLALQVSEAGAVTVNGPMRMAWHHIEAFLIKHAGWLKSRLERARAGGFAWQDGAELPYLGSLRRLVLQADALPFVMPVGERLLVGGTADVSQLVVDWYRQEARGLLQGRLVDHAARLDRPLPRFRLSDAATRWGSLSPKGVVSLNWRLIKATWAEIDYVICHELAHQRVPNHSPTFWREVAVLCPDYEAARLRLRQSSRLYFAF